LRVLRGPEGQDRDGSGVLRILILEDSKSDAELLGARLYEGGIGHELARVQDRDEFVAALEEDRIDLILADYALPGFDGLSALKLAKELCPGVPFIFISDTPGEEVAIEAVKSGAADYVLKRRLERLSPAVLGAMREAEERRERERTEEEITRLASFTKPSPTLIVEISAAREPTFINPAAQERFPTLAEVGRRHPILADLTTVDQEIKESGGRPLTSEVWVDEVLYQRLIFKVPGCDLLRLHITDVTERRRAEESLKRSEELYRTVVEQTEENIFVVDLESRRILEANAALQHSLGYTLEELKDMTLYDVVAHDQEDVDKTSERITGEGLRFIGERKYRRKDASLVDVEVNVGVIPYGERRAMCIVAHDVTDHKRSEVALRQSLSVLMALREAGQVLSSTLESEEIVTRLLEIMRGVANLTAAVISRFDQEGNLRVWRSAGLEDLWPRIRFTPEARATRRAVLENEEQQLLTLRRPGHEDQSCILLCLPIGSRDGTVGVLEAFGQESLAKADMIEIVSSLTSQASSALENARLYEELGNRERMLQDLVEKLLGAQEEERRRVAYEVHDGLAQVAVAAHQNLQAFARRHTPETEQGRRELDRILRQVRTTVSDARQVIANLRPTVLDDLGLAAAISLEIERFNEEGYHVDYKEHLDEDRLPGEIEITLFRIVQEALTNIRKHAGTPWVRIELRRRDGGVYLEVRDFGRGFDPAALETFGSGPGERVGFAGMRERVSMLGGELDIRSRPDAGTSVAASIPLTRTV
jgi:PAS domain S-box-containing protein